METREVKNVSSMQFFIMYIASKKIYMDHKNGKLGLPRPTRIKVRPKLVISRFAC